MHDEPQIGCESEPFGVQPREAPGGDEHVHTRQRAPERLRLVQRFRLGLGHLTQRGKGVPGVRGEERLGLDCGNAQQDPGLFRGWGPLGGSGSAPTV